MTHFIAIADQARNAFDLFEGETLDAVFAAAVADLGGHPAIAEGHVEDHSTGYSTLHLRDLHNRAFWFTVMAHLFDANDNREWFIDDDRATAVASAEAYLAPVSE